MSVEKARRKITKMPINLSTLKKIVLMKNLEPEIDGVSTASPITKQAPKSAEKSNR